MCAQNPYLGSGLVSQMAINISLFFWHRRLDYFVVSERLLPHVTDVVIRKDVFGSDHCPLVIGLTDHSHLPHTQLIAEQGTLKLD